MAGVYKSIGDARLAEDGSIQVHVIWKESFVTTSAFTLQNSSPEEWRRVRALARACRQKALRQRKMKAKKAERSARQQLSSCTFLPDAEDSATCPKGMVHVPVEHSAKFDDISTFLGARINPSDPKEVQVLVQWQSSIVRAAWLSDSYAAQRLSAIAKDKGWPTDLKDLKRLRQVASQDDTATATATATAAAAVAASATIAKPATPCTVKTVKHCIYGDAHIAASVDADSDADSDATQAATAVPLYATDS